MDFYQRKLADIDDRRSEVEKTLKGKLISCSFEHT